MPLPTLSDVHVDQLLTNISVKYSNPAYFADQIFPLVEVRNQSDKYAFYTKDYWFRDDAGRHAPGDTPNYVGYAITTACNYSCDGFDATRLIPDELVRNQTAPIDLEAEATQYVTDKILLRRERAIIADHLKAQVWGTSVCGAGTSFTNWDTYATSTPIEDMRVGVDTVLQNTGRRPNLLVLGNKVFSDLADHPDFIDRIKYAQVGITTEDLIGRIFGVDRVVVVRSIYVSTLEGAATQTYAFNLNRDAGLFYVPARPGLLEPSAGYTFVWSGGLPGAARGTAILRWRNEERHSNVVQAMTWYDQKMVSSDCGYWFHDAVSST